MEEELYEALKKLLAYAESTADLSCSELVEALLNAEEVINKYEKNFK